jgi:hypothetical protein
VSGRPALDCGCRALARRRCDLCPAQRSFLACGAACLRRHLDARHPGAAPAPARARAFQAEVNSLGRDARAAYQGHRVRLTRLLAAAQRAAGLCVLGAGNGNDLDLPRLTALFGEVHLVDLDDRALARAVAGLPAGVRARVSLHTGVDLSGCLEHLDRWGDDLPDQDALAAFAAGGARALAGRLGHTFDVVLSACLVSQLCHPFQNTLALPRNDWQRLFAAVTRLHLTTAALLTRPGGTGVIACDVLCHAGAAIERLRGEVGPERLAKALVQAVESGAITPDPDPRALVRLLGSPGLAGLVDRVHVTEPWPWDLGTAHQVVYGVVFRRA